tara:strand:- start:13442 stop:13792 length:351 start_codon:yes stop_codon:yes gene_type:complete
MTYKTCKERIQQEYQDRLEQIRTEEEPPFLSFDYVEPNTFEGQEVGYYRYQMSWGGPSDEFRMYDNSDKIQYWFLDWFDGAFIEVDDIEVVDLVNSYIESVKEKKLNPLNKIFNYT